MGDLAPGRVEDDQVHHNKDVRTPINVTLQIIGRD